MCFIVKDCCFCVELRTGALIIGYLHMAANILLPLILICNLVAVHSVLGDSLSSENKTTSALIVCLLFVVIFLSLVFNTLFLVGIQKNIPGYVQAYIVFLMNATTVTFIVFITGIVKGAAPGDTVKLFLNIVVQLYFIVVIRSYLSKMLTSERGPAIMDKAYTERSNQNEQNV